MADWWKRVVQRLTPVGGGEQRLAHSGGAKSVDDGPAKTMLAGAAVVIGALVFVTHDRYLLDRVATRLLALDGRGGATSYADYRQWEEDRRPRAAPGVGAGSSTSTGAFPPGRRGRPSCS